MKTLLSFLATCILGMYVHAQTIQLRNYQIGEQISDTIYSYYGNLPFSGNGYISLSENLSSELMPGVFLKLVIDSTNKGESPSHAAFKVIDDENIAVHKGDIVSMPARLRVYAGKIGFHIIVHGKPVTVNQEYFCGLEIMFTTGEDFGMYLKEDGSTMCRVTDLSMGINKKTYNSVVSVYPNPTTNEVTINGSVEMIGLAYSISNAMGTIVTSGNIENERSVVSISHLLPGVYYVTVENAAPVKVIKQ